MNWKWREKCIVINSNANAKQSLQQILKFIFYFRQQIIRFQIQFSSSNSPCALLPTTLRIHEDQQWNGVLWRSDLEWTGTQCLNIAEKQETVISTSYLRRSSMLLECSFHLFAKLWMFGTNFPRKPTFLSILHVLSLSVDFYSFTKQRC